MKMLETWNEKVLNANRMKNRADPICFALQKIYEFKKYHLDSHFIRKKRFYRKLKIFFHSSIKFYRNSREFMECFEYKEESFLIILKLCMQ